jgi:hypothetical protein
MRDSIIIKEDFCDEVEVVRHSALTGGFGTLTPAQTEMGATKYEGMGFLGRHDLMVRALVQSIKTPVYPGAMFFRVTKPGTEKAYIHSDRGHGDWTAIVYLSDHEDVSGTAFFRHKPTGWREMPAPEEMKKRGILAKMDECMKAGRDEEWEQLDFVRGIFNRALIFHAPLFHARRPENGLGDGKDETARMVWVCHFYV